MMIARWKFDARFGKKSEAVALLKEWNETFGNKIGWTSDKVRMLTGHIGGSESMVASEVKVKDLAELDAAFEELAKLDGHAEWGKKMDAVIVSGSTNWEVYREV